MTMLDRINQLLVQTGNKHLFLVASGDCHEVLDEVDRTLGIRTRTQQHRVGTWPPPFIPNEYVGARVRRLEHAVIQRNIARTFNNTPDYFHLGFEAEAA